MNKNGLLYVSGKGELSNTTPSGKGWFAIPCSHFTEPMWSKLNNKKTNKDIANHFGIGIHIAISGVCQTCHLSKDQLDTDAIVLHREQEAKQQTTEIGIPENE